jgi:cytoskeleton protein RodZ
VASFGARLKQEREQRGVTLDDISLSTKIGTRMLRALEEEHFDQLPGGIFNKGFIRAYARTLGMDEEQVIAEYLAATGTSPLGINSENVSNNNSDQVPGPELRAQLQARTQEEGPSAATIPWGMLAVALIVIALGFVVWDFYSRQSQKGTTQADASASNPPSSAIADQSSLQQSPAQPKPVESVATTALAPKPNATNVSTTTHGEPSTSMPAAASKPPQPLTPASGAFLVLIKAREDSWISITVDGEVTTRRILAASSQKTFAAHQELVIRAGNVGALDFEFNGKKLSQQGASGEAKTLTFDANGLQSTPQKPETPAPLPQSP